MTLAIELVWLLYCPMGTHPAGALCPFCQTLCHCVSRNKSSTSLSWTRWWCLAKRHIFFFVSGRCKLWRTIPLKLELFLCTHGNYPAEGHAIFARFYDIVLPEAFSFEFLSNALRKPDLLWYHQPILQKLKKSFLYFDGDVMQIGIFLVCFLSLENKMAVYAVNALRNPELLWCY